MQKSEERRTYERFSARFPVKFKDDRNDYGTDVFLRDASAEGVRVLTKERFFLGDRLSLEVELPDGQGPMVLNGRVVWSKLLNLSLWDTGIQFPEVNFFKMQRLFKLTQEIA
ncbi:MAG: PilZ domain-containing protein [Candidatus Omnitrophica bacterium]|nr:PilZ domain-containing protein [Candidatus Omnitrophota bacterium]MDE2009494.1 PilZ domain-containing protein [Candidatus Omnitrophota bacterium]MDE2215096.1 PilZ domain-containing protein [Candidatus Omnitrophota bacterium]MDE2232057.1 PilZ domain-containing protein [Candidatus Omnitrophota bacterium]